MLPLGVVAISLLSWLNLEWFSTWTTDVQRLLQPGTRGKLVQAGFDSFMSRVVEDAKIPGLTLGIVHPNGMVEQTSYGIRGEEGEVMTVDVSPDLLCDLVCLLGSHFPSADVIYPRIMFESIPIFIRRYPYR